MRCLCIIGALLLLCEVSFCNVNPILTDAAKISGYKEYSFNMLLFSKRNDALKM